MSRDPILRNALSIGAATAVYAVSFGVLSVAAGFSVVQTCVLSVVCFTGASQLTFVSVIAAGGGVAGALPPALLLAARNAIYAVSLKDIVSGSVPKRALRAQVIVDETTAMAHAQTTPADKRRAFDLTALCLFTAWNAGTLIGALAGSAWATHGPTASTWCSRQCSWPCSLPSCVGRRRCAPRWRAR